jgi:serine/threonine protein kinase
MRHIASLGSSQKQTTNRQDAYKRDIYSVGLVLYYAFSGRTPFNVKTAAAIAKQMEAGPSFDGPIWSKVSDNAKKFITLLLSSQPDARPTADVALSHPWVADLAAILRAQYAAAPPPQIVGSASSNDLLSNSTTSSGNPSPSDNNNNQQQQQQLGLTRRTKGKSYEDLTALHEQRALDSRDFDAIYLAHGGADGAGGGGAAGTDSDSSVPRARDVVGAAEQFDVAGCLAGGCGCDSAPGSPEDAQKSRGGATRVSVD